MTKSSAAGLDRAVPLGCGMQLMALAQQFMPSLIN
jgi:hypothetical protein